MSQKLCIGLLGLLVACVNDVQQGPLPSTETDASAVSSGSVTDAATPAEQRTDARSAVGPDAETSQLDGSAHEPDPDGATPAEDDAAATPSTDAAVDDAQQPASDPTLTPRRLVSTPKVSRDNPNALVCVPSSKDSPQTCPGPNCVPAVQTASVNPQGAGRFVCLGDCFPTPREYELYSSDDGTLHFTLRFSQRVTAASPAQVLRDSLYDIAGYTDGLSYFVGDPDMVELLENVGGRLHIRGWGKVYSDLVLVPGLPSDCSSEHVFKLCPWTACGYQDPGTDIFESRLVGYAWLHYDMEAPMLDSSSSL